MSRIKGAAPCTGTDFPGYGNGTFKPGPNQFRFALNTFKSDMNPFKSEADRFKSGACPNLSLSEFLCLRHNHSFPGLRYASNTKIRTGSKSGPNTFKSTLKRFKFRVKLFKPKMNSFKSGLSRFRSELPPAHTRRSCRQFGLRQPHPAPIRVIQGRHHDANRPDAGSGFRCRLPCVVSPPIIFWRNTRALPHDKAAARAPRYKRGTRCQPPARR